MKNVNFSNLGKVNFSTEPMERLCAILIDSAKQGIGGTVVTPNVEILRQMSLDHDLFDLVTSSKYLTCDSQILKWLLGRNGRQNVQRVTGSDLLPRVLALANFHGLRIGVIGGHTDHQAKITSYFSVTFPSATLTFIDTSEIHASLPFSPDSSVLNVNELCRIHSPHVVVVALGFPKQEIVSRFLLEENPGTLFLNVGMALAFMTGIRKRAPLGWQKVGLEWLWRLCQEPKRLWRRYIVDDFPFVIKLFRSVRKCQ